MDGEEAFSNGTCALSIGDTQLLNLNPDLKSLKHVEETDNGMATQTFEASITSTNPSIPKCLMPSHLGHLRFCLDSSLFLIYFISMAFFKCKYFHLLQLSSVWQKY